MDIAKLQLQPMITSGSVATSVKEKPPRECLICGGPTRYAHMEIDACRACAVFYRRLCEKQKKPLTCRTGKFDCDTTKNGNFCCKRCRYDRFSAVLNESRKRSNDESSVAEPSTSSLIQDVSTPFLSQPKPENSVIEGVRRGHSLMNAIRRTSELSTRTNNIPDDQGIFADGMMMIPTTYTMLNQNIRILISSIFEFASAAFEEFKELDLDEKHLLVRNFFPFIAVLDSEYRKLKHLPDQKSLVFSSYSTYIDHCTVEKLLSGSPAVMNNRDDAQRFVSAFLDGDVQQNRMRMLRWNPSEDEYIALLGICFWSLDKVTVSEKVHQIADNYRRMIFLELDGLYRQKMGIGEFASRMGEAMLFVEAIQSSFLEMRTKMGMLKLMDIIGEEYLLAELHL